MSHNITREYDAQFLIRKILELRWTPQLIIDGTKILNLIVENLHFLDSLNFLPMSLKSIPKSFHLTCKELHYTDLFNTAENLDCVCPYSVPKFYGADYMLGDEQAQFLGWYE